MPRGPSRLTEEDGPLARFALGLRALRDAAGFDAPSVDQIAARTGIPRSTLFAALRGQRLPTRPVLGALVTGWGGNAEEWLVRRTATEAELQAASSRRSGTSRTPPSPEPEAATATSSAKEHGVAILPGPEQVSIAERNTTLQAMAAQLSDLRAQTGAKAASQPPGREPAFSEALHRMAAQLRALRMQAGEPTLRQLAQRIRENDTLPAAPGVAGLSEVFNGRRLPRWNTLLAIVTVLNGDTEAWHAEWMRLATLQPSRPRL